MKGIITLEAAIINIISLKFKSIKSQNMKSLG
jgi:hypothetical protein